MTRLEALGPLDLRDETGEPLEALLKQPKRAALLVYLALAEPAGFHRRDSILLLFWPDLTAERARAALRKSLYVLRGAVGPEIFLTRGDDEIGIDWQHLECDVLDFTSALAAGQIVEALEHYRADLLTGFYLSDASPEWEQWLEGRRATLRTQAAEAAWSHANELAEAGKVAEGIKWARWACTRTPDDEPGIRRLLGLLGELGDRAGALHFYDEFATRLRGDYGGSPAPETQELMKAIRARVSRNDDDMSPPIRSGDDEEPISQAVARPSEPLTTLPPDESRITPTKWPRWTLIAVPLVAALIAVVVLTRGSKEEPIESNLVAVAPFTVLSPELAVWREGLTDLLSRNFHGAGPLRTVSPSRIIALASADGSNGGSEDDLGRLTGAGLVVFGNVLALAGDSVRITASVLDRTTDQRFGDVEMGGSTERMDVVIDSLSRALLRNIGTVRRIGSSRIASIGSTSVPALKAFLSGEQFFRRTAWDSARGQFEKAVELDTAFAMGWLRLGQVNAMGRWPVPGSPEQAEGLIQVSRAGRLNRGLPERDSLIVEALSRLADFLLERVSSDSAHLAHSAALSAVAEYPDDPESWGTLATVEDYYGEALTSTDSSVLANYSRAIELDSGFALPVRLALRVTSDIGDVSATRRLAAHYLTLDEAPATRAVPTAILTLLDPLGTEESRAAMLDTTSMDALWPTFMAIWTIPDSQEATVQLARELTRGPDARRYWFNADFISRRNLAAVLGFRGHLAEAFRLAGTERSTWFANLLGELAVLGAVPGATVDSTFRDWTENHADTPGIHEATIWWAGTRDTTAIRRWMAARPFGATSGDSAYLALARGDTAQAITRLGSIGWLSFLDRLVYIRLLAATGRAPEALAILKRRAPNDWPIPSQVVWKLERARLAEAAGEAALAADDYRYVIRAWRNADQLLQPFVEEAREALRRLGREDSS